MPVMVRPRMYFDCDDKLKWALRLRAARENMDMSDFVQHLVTEALTAELSEVDRIIAKGGSIDRKSDRGRPRKSS